MNTYVTHTWSCTMRLVTADPRVLKRAAADFETLLAGVDRVASRFRADSALSKANRQAGKPTPVPALLVDLVVAALQAAQESDGAVDPTIGRALRHAGYDRDIAEVTSGESAGAAVVAAPAAASPVQRAGAHGWRGVRLNRDLGLLTVPVGVELDLGATAKAYVADYAARALAARYDTAVLVELGGDIAVAGAKPGGWVIHVAEREGDPGQRVQLRYGGIATSTTTIRRWDRGGQLRHHIIDPATGCSADGPWRTVTVSAPCALAANVASTAAIVKGVDALDWLEQRQLPARLVGVDGQVVTTATWPAQTGAPVSAVA